MNTQSKQTNGSKSGFTIIEVVLVLAIAGLIFLMVFLALPALQRNQRDTQRKQDLSRFLSQISSYQSNNRGQIPNATTMSTFITSYMRAGSDTFTDPSGGDYVLTNVSRVPSMNATTGVAEFNYMVGTTASCAAGVPSASGSASTGRKIAVSIALEGGGAYCQTN